MAALIQDTTEEDAADLQFPKGFIFINKRFLTSKPINFFYISNITMLKLYSDRFQ